MATKKLLNSLIWIIVFQLIGYCLGQVTQVNSATWYQALHKSSLTPPAIVFPIVWSVLYVMIAIAGYFLWHHRQQPQARMALGCYSAQMLLNWAWTPLFFHYHLIAVSFYCIIIMAILTFITIFLTKKYVSLTSAMLIPYFVWLLFAGYLNGMIWMLN